MTSTNAGEVIDSHLHLWSPTAAFHQWPGADLLAIHRAFGLDDLSAATRSVDRVIVVQAQPDVAETEWLLDLAARDDRILGVVGWLALDAADAPTQVARLAARPGLVGLRPMLHNLADPRWILGEAVQPALRAMAARGIAFDVLVRPHHLDVVHELAMRHPTLRIVVDHGAKPAIGRGDGAAWRHGIAALGRLPNLWCKLSGLWTEQDAGADREACRPHIAHLLHSFPRRVMWGSDWPVLLLSGDRYDDWLAFAREAVRSAAPDEMAAVFVGAARDFYRLRQRRADPS